ncbi:MAG: beta-galactosidase trimerization domain-containing protein, partial [Spirochaetales bacterium]|nr:beta-galactosidase trimerization domain-containing protein [Spirochaetales bacterium]
RAIRGAYRVYTELGFTVDFITPELLRSGYADDYAVIHMPALFHLDSATAAAAARYVEGGGFLVGTAQGGVVGERGWYNRGLPCGALAATFGVRVTGVESGVTPQVTYRGRNYKGHWHRDFIAVASEFAGEKGPLAEIVGRFFDDRPAVVRNLVGKGAALYVATHFDAAYVEGARDLAFDLLRDLLAERGIAPALTVEYANRCEREVDIHRLTGGETEMLLCTQLVPRARRSEFFVDGKKPIRVHVRREAATTSITDVFTGETVPFTTDGGTVHFAYTLRRDRVAALMIR